MEKVYILWNFDIDEPVFASTDKGLVEEIMCDAYFDDIYQEYLYRCLGRPSFYENLTINEIYDDITEWYNMYMSIVEVPVRS